MSHSSANSVVPVVAQHALQPHVRAASMFARALIFVVRLYQWLLRPFLGGSCRFEPSCSRYAVACLESHGAARGSLLSVRRLCKCHPFHPGGVDLPPPPLRAERRHAS